MANHLFGHAYIHFSQIQLKIILNKASIDYDGSDTKEALFQLAQAFELSLSERSRRVLDQQVDVVVLQKKKLISAESELETLISRLSAGEDGGCEDEEEVERMLTCEACLDEMTTESFPEGNITVNCEPHGSICSSCIQAHISIHIRESPADTLTCPLCVSRMSSDDVQLLAEQDLFDEYCRRAFQDYLRNDPNYHNCLGPNCGSGQIAQDAQLTLMTCHACSFHTCIRHQVPWHHGRTCHQYDVWLADTARQDDENTASLEHIHVNTKPCPTCSIRLVKNGGCDHFTCRPQVQGCGYEFCWGCGRPWATIDHGLICPVPSEWYLPWYL